MKKKIITILSTVIVFMATMVSAHAENNIAIQIDGNIINFSDQNPVMIDGRIMLPIRAIFENLGGTVTWDQTTKTATTMIKKRSGLNNYEDSQISITENSNIITTTYGLSYKKPFVIDVMMDVPAQNINGRLCVPIRYVTNAVGLIIHWSDANQTAYIEKPVGIRFTDAYYMNSSAPSYGVPVDIVVSPDGHATYIYRYKTASAANYAFYDYKSILIKNNWNVEEVLDGYISLVKNNENVRISYFDTLKPSLYINVYTNN